jgi:hypothetical protein
VGVNSLDLKEKDMPSDKAPVVSFNQWLSLQRDHPVYGQLASTWAVTRGRLTQSTVVARAAGLGVSAEVAGAAYDDYLAATAAPVKIALP